MPPSRTELKEEDAALVRQAWDEYRALAKEAERSRRALLRVLRRMHRRYPVAGIARAGKVTAPAVWAKLRDTA